MRNYFATWFYSEQANDESYYPSVGAHSSSAEFQYVYWRCIYVFYQSALITNKDVVTDWLFFTNVEKLPTVDGVNFKEFFAKNNIQVVYMELSRKTPKDWFGAWRNQFYLFDVLDYLKDLEGNHLILDSDCVISHRLDALYEDIQKEGVLTLPIDYAEEHSINGCSMNDMRILYQQFFDTEYPKKLGYVGGEFIAMTSECISQLLQIFYIIWKKNYQLYQNGEKKLNEEAHALSLCYYHMGKQNEFGRKYIRRIWTDMVCDQVQPEDVKLPIWHLPAEKRFGFHQLFHIIRKYAKNNEAAKMPAETFYKKSNQVMKLSVSRKIRKMNWYVRYGKNKIRKIWKVR